MIFIITERNRSGAHRDILHRVKVPELGEKKGYVTLVSLNWFMYGFRKGISKKNRTFKDLCSYGPESNFNSEREEWWDERRKREKNSDSSDMEIVIHESLDDFYKYIGFDKKGRKYR